MFVIVSYCFYFVFGWFRSWQLFCLHSLLARSQSGIVSWSCRDWNLRWRFWSHVRRPSGLQKYCHNNSQFFRNWPNVD